MSWTKKCFFIVTLLVTICAQQAWAISYPVPQNRVSDFANIIPPEIEKKLIADLNSLDKATTIELVVVTVPSLGGASIEAYTLGLANAWGVGKKGKNNGVVLLFAPTERKVRIEVGSGLTSTISNAAVVEIIKSDILPLLRKGQMSDGVVAGTHSIMSKLGYVVPSAVSVTPKKALNTTVAKPAPAQDSGWSASYIFAGLAAIVILAVILIFILVERSRRSLARQDFVQQITELRTDMQKSWRDIQALNSRGWEEDRWKDANKKLVELENLSQPIAGGQLETVASELEEVKRLVEWISQLAPHQLQHEADEKRNKIDALHLAEYLPGIIAQVKVELTAPEATSGIKDYFHRVMCEYSKALTQLEDSKQSDARWKWSADKLRQVRDWLAQVRSDVQAQKEAKQKAKALLAAAPEKLAALEAGAHTSHRQNDLAKARAKHDEAQRLANNNEDDTDWVAVAAAAYVVMSICDSSSTSHSSHSSHNDYGYDHSSSSGDDYRHHDDYYDHHSGGGSIFSDGDGGLGGGSFGGGGGSGDY